MNNDEFSTAMIEYYNEVGLKPGTKAEDTTNEIVYKHYLHLVSRLRPGKPVITSVTEC